MSNEQTGLVLTSKQSNKVKRALKALEDVRKEFSFGYDVNWYLEDCGNLYLMEGYTHDAKGAPNHGMAIEVFDFNQASGGAW